MTKAVMKRLLKSEFFHEVKAVIEAWDYYLTAGDKELADEMMHKRLMAKLALEYITGNIYGLSRNGETYSLVNEQNYDDRLLIGQSAEAKEVEA